MGGSMWRNVSMGIDVYPRVYRGGRGVDVYPRIYGGCRCVSAVSLHLPPIDVFLHLFLLRMHIYHPIDVGMLVVTECIVRFAVYTRNLEFWCNSFLMIMSQSLHRIRVLYYS